MRMAALPIAAMFGVLFDPGAAQAVTTVFFNSSQTTNLVNSASTSDTISSEGYLFTFTRDKFFTGGTTNPPGRYLRIFWPEGLEAQAVTAGPAPSKARIDIRRQDGQFFAIESFTAKLLANTAGAGGAIEVMPLLNGDDGFLEPLRCEASGYYGQNFTYITPTLTGFDSYKMTLYVDYALLSLAVVDASIAPPALEIFQVDATSIQLSWPTNAADYALERATHLPTTVWQPVTNNVTISGDLFTVQLEATAARQMYRLKK